ncbi:MFS transporter [Microbacteriaceae bacterium VKM Ac-2854]|nr:MFS transporter [Microbacteriaceae bacterium VKM Ac-2854]
MSTVGADAPPRTRPAPTSLRPILAPLSGLMIAQFVSGLSATIVATSIPTIMRTLEGPASMSTWLVAATILGNTASTPIWGRLADLFPPKRILQASISIFIVGSVLAGLSVSTGMLLAARALQGIGLGGTGAVTLAVVAYLVVPRERGRVNGYLQSLQTAATILGPIVGGVIVQYLGWRWCFFVALPLAIVSILVLSLKLHIRAQPRTGARTDYAGAALIATGIPSALICLTMLGDDGGLTPVSAAFGAFGLLALVALVIVELRVSAPIIPVRLLARRVPFVCVLAGFLLGSTLFGGSVFVTQYLQIGLGIEPAVSGFLLAPMALGAVAASWIAGRAISRTARVKPVLLIAATLMLLGNVALALAPFAPMPLALAGALLLSAGLGMAIQNLVLAAQTVAGTGRVGSVSAVVVFFFTLGGTVGLVGYGAAFSARLGTLEAAGATQAEAYALGLPLVFAISAVAVTVAFGVLCALPDLRLRSSFDPVTEPITTG